MTVLNKIPIVLKSFAAILMLCFIQTIAFAQDKKVDVNITTDKGGGGNWYAQPWVWVVGVAVFIIIIIAITRSGNTRRDV